MLTKQAARAQAMCTASYWVREPCIEINKCSKRSFFSLQSHLNWHPDTLHKWATQTCPIRHFILAGHIQHNIWRNTVTNDFKLFGMKRWTRWGKTNKRIIPNSLETVLSSKSRQPFFLFNHLVNSVTPLHPPPPPPPPPPEKKQQPKSNNKTMKKLWPNLLNT